MAPSRRLGGGDARLDRGDEDVARRVVREDTRRDAEVLHAREPDHHHIGQRFDRLDRAPGNAGLEPVAFTVEAGIVAGQPPAFAGLAGFVEQPARGSALLKAQQPVKQEDAGGKGDISGEQHRPECVVRQPILSAASTGRPTVKQIR